MRISSSLGIAPQVRKSLPVARAFSGTALHAPAVQVALLDVASQGEGPRWNLLQWLQYWCTRHAETNGAAAAAAPVRTHSASSLDDEADSRRDAKRR